MDTPYHRKGLPTLADHVYLKVGDSKVAKKFLLLKDDHVWIFDSSSDTDPSSQIPLDNASILSNQEGYDIDEMNKILRDHRAPLYPKYEYIVIIKMGNVAKYFLCFHKEMKASAWSLELDKAISRVKGLKQIFGNTLERLVQRRHDGVLIPEILEVLTAAIGRGIEEEKLFQIRFEAEEERVVKMIVEESMELKDFAAQVTSVHVAAGLLVRFFEKLPESVIPTIFLNDIYELYETKRRFEIDILAPIIQRLPRVNYMTLMHMVKFFSKVAESAAKNKASVSRISRIFGNLFFPPTGSGSNAPMLNELLLKHLIQNHARIFYAEDGTSSEAFAASTNEQESGPVARVVYPYKPEQKDHLELRVGDLIVITDEVGSGWFFGKLLSTGEEGIFPVNFVERVDSSPQSSGEAAGPGSDARRRLSSMGEIGKKEKVVLNMENVYKENLEMLQKFEKLKRTEGKESVVELTNFFDELLDKVFELRNLLDSEIRMRTELEKKIEEL